MSELKPCPFCGEQHQWKDSMDLHHGPSKIISCRNRRVLLSVYPDEDIEYWVKFWNTRPIEDQLRAELEQSQKENNELSYLVDLAIAWFATISSADGSGHKDLANRLEQMKLKLLNENNKE